MKNVICLLSLFMMFAGCSAQAKNTYTLYRNSPLDKAERVFFASFDAADSVDFNRGNCTMAARLLNANVIAANKRDGKTPIEGIGFWCETGPYKESGSVPNSFEAAYPAGTDNPLSW